MSFILDALKKAEAERNRRVAPVLMDARIALPRRRLPGWVWPLGAALLVNLGLLAWLLLRAPQQQQAIALDATAAPAAQPATVEVSPAPALPTAAPPNQISPPPDVLPVPVSAARNAPQLPTMADDETLPTLAELQATGVPLPQLVLDLHVYTPTPGSRSVLLNGQRLREGEYSPQGVKVERITAQGVVLEAAGRRFRLRAGD
jgi:general secretion pathway protein B